MREAFKEGLVGFLVIAGIVICLISVFFGAAFAGGGIMRATYTREPSTGRITDAGDTVLVPYPVMTFACGLMMIGGSIGYGLWKNHKRFSGSATALANAYVISRQGYKADWSTMLSEWELEHEDRGHYTVTLRTPNGTIEQYECRPETYFACGEGMIGEATVQGKWVGRFMPYMGIKREEF